MILNKIRHEVNGSGGFLNHGAGSVRALQDYTTILELVSPLPIDTSVMAAFILYDSRDITLPLFMFPTGKKGNQVSENPEVANWNVWEVAIDKTILSAIGRYIGGRVGLTYSFRDRVTTGKALVYRGHFSKEEDLPVENNIIGDYYVCDRYNVTVGNVIYTYGDNALWNGETWVRDRNYRILMTTSTIPVPVDPAFIANIPDVPEQDIADLIAQWGGGFVNMESHINDQDIHVSPLDRERWDDMLPRDGSEPMEADLDLGGNKLINVDEIKVGKISANGGTYIEIVDDIDMNGKGIYGAGEVEGEFGTFNNSLTKGGKEVATIEYVDNKDTDKLDKIWTDLTNQTTSFLTDEFVLNRGNNVYKTTLATMLSNVAGTEIFIVVQELPEIGQINKIYLVPKGTPEAQNTYDEFIWVNSAWENLGTITIDLSNYYNKTEVNGLLSAKVDKNNAITAGTKAKITYDAKGLVTGGADLVPSDIPQLAPSKITQDANNRFVTDTEKSTWNGKQNALTAGNNITIVENVISATSGGGGGYEPDGETITLNSNDELEATNVAIWRYS